MRIVALIAIGLNPHKTRATGGHSYINLAKPLPIDRLR